MSEAQNLACPVCGCPKERDVLVGIAGTEWGQRFACGTIYWPAKKQTTVNGVACGIIAQLRAGGSEPAVSKTPSESTLASATGSVVWEPAAHKPPSYQSVLVYGVLECEQSADTHEGYWTGQRWQSVRRDDDISALRKLKLLNVTHWACRPTPPNAEPSHAAKI